MQIISRDQWGATAPNKALQGWPSGQPSSWTLHYEGVDVAIDEGDYAPRVRNIQAYHQRTGYSDIAYNFVVAPNGQVFEGRGWDYRSAAQANGNPVSLAICYLGGPNTELTDQAKAAMNWLIGQRPLQVLPHRHWLATACPGEQILAWLDAGRPDSGGVPPAPPILVAPTPDTVTFVRPGQRGDAVRIVQDKVRAHGFNPGPSDGIYGKNTGAAIRAFQGSRGLAADGIVGPLTWAALEQTPAGAPPRLLRHGSTGPDVSALQDALHRAGINAGPVDGIFGTITDSAVRSFQTMRGLAVDGIVGPQTRGALGI